MNSNSAREVEPKNIDEIRTRYLGPQLRWYYEYIMMQLASLTQIAKPMHSIQVDPKLTFHGHIKHLRVRQDSDDFNDYPFEDEFDKLNPGKKDEATRDSI